MSLTPEGRRVFASLTVGENLRLGGALRREAEVKSERERLLEQFPVLKARFDHRAGNLSGGEQQQLAIARSLMSNPKILLLDEPSLGLAPKFVDVIFDIVAKLREDGVTILLVEQNVDRALEIADRAYVLSTGQLALEGKTAVLRASSGIERAYLGIGAE
jgi:branched-chain amino acid transport system ATP-binding protein